MIIDLLIVCYIGGILSGVILMVSIMFLSKKRSVIR